MVSLMGQVIVITGAGRGIGRSLAEAAADVGALVSVVEQSAADADAVAEDIRRRGGRALPVSGDVSDVAVVRDIVQRVERELGPVDILVNNAGMMSPVGPDWVVSADDWWRTFEVNVRAAFLCAKAVLPGMIARRRGRIINLTSSAAYRTQPYTSAYSASKAALTQFTRCLAASVAEHGVGVFAFAPGLVRTAMTEALAFRAESVQWVGAGLGRALAEGRTTPMSQVVDAFLRLAAGHLDSLSGRHIDVRDGFARLQSAASTIERDEALLRLIRKELPAD